MLDEVNGAFVNLCSALRLRAQSCTFCCSNFVKCQSAQQSIFLINIFAASVAAGNKSEGFLSQLRVADSSSKTSQKNTVRTPQKNLATKQKNGKNLTYTERERRFKSGALIALTAKF
jgi:hypothetical protein